MASIEIDGKTIEIEGEATIIEVADKAGIPIPRFCYHKKLSVAANCRMCLVEVEKSNKPLPACATPISDGMKVFTRSAKTREAQRSVMEFLLVNHPLDCPVCDQGGECELQDVSLTYGSDRSRFEEGKRAVPDKNLGSLIATEMTRCIHCTRCVRFGVEVAGLPELGATGRGEDLRIGTYIEKQVSAEVSGNMIDLCPVGALTSKPYRFTARSWEMIAKPSLSPHDALGSHLSLNVRGQQVMRVLPREAPHVNENWLSDRDRFSYEALQAGNRLTEPLYKKADGTFEAISWSEAIERAVGHLSHAQKIQACISPSSTLEEGFLFSKLLEKVNQAPPGVLGAPRSSLVAPLPWGFEAQHLADFEQADGLLSLGCDWHTEQPVLALRLRRMALQTCAVFNLGSVPNVSRFPVQAESRIAVSAWLPRIEALTQAVLSQIPHAINQLPKDLSERLKKAKLASSDRAWAEAFANAKSKWIILGDEAIQHPDYPQFMPLLQYLSKLTHTRLGLLSRGANLRGLQAFVTPFILDKNSDCLWLSDVDLAVEALYPNPQQTVIASTGFRSPALDAVTQLYLPIAHFYESGGSFVNLVGQIETANAAVSPRGQAKPLWKILRVIATELGFSDLAFETLASVHEAASQAFQAAQAALEDSPLEPSLLKTGDVGLSEALAKADLVLITRPALYQVDPWVRRAKALQATQQSQAPCLRLHPSLVQKLDLSQPRLRLVHEGQVIFEGAYVVDDKLDPKTLVLASGFEATRHCPPYLSLAGDSIHHA